MSRIRTIKPEFLKHEDLFDAEIETGLPLRVAFVGLWTVADREGRFRWRPRSLKSDCLPFDDCDFSRVLDALATRGFIVRYRQTDELGSHDFGHIPSWLKHQVINHRESKSILPNPEDCEIIDEEYQSVVPHVVDACSTRVDACTVMPRHARGEREGKGKGIGKGKGKKDNIDFSSKNLSPKKFGQRAFSKKVEFEKEDFERFWTAYGHKQQRRRSEQAFGKALSKATLDTILAAVKRYHETRPPWQQIALAASWLNGERWTDEVSIGHPSKPNGHDPPVHDPHAAHLAYWREQGISEERIAELKEKLGG